MYLKEIKIDGFKSFANKIKLNFKQGITGIVGPNGAGKSNIVDAVRWVLGEQSIRSLRGDATMSDVIFSGSKSRKPASYAAVTLIFDNSDYYLKIEEDELAIKRIVYQNGDNEYYLNNQRCRLKDLTNLMIDTGLTKEAYNIIAQDQIQSIINNSANERRIIIEEVAGVLKYKKRKEKALLKLTKTHDNINRLNDIMIELNNQLEPLADQKTKANQFLVLKEELKEIEISLIVNEIDYLNNDYQQSKKKIERLKEDLITIKNEELKKQATLEEDKVNFIKDNDLLHQLEKELVSLSSQAEKISGQKNLIIERKQYQDDNPKLHHQLLLLKEEQLKINSELDLLKPQLKDKLKKQTDLKDKIKHQQLILTEKLQAKEELKDKINDFIKKTIALKYKKELLEQSIEQQNRLSYPVKAILSNPKLKGIHNVIGNLIKMEDDYLEAIDIALGASNQFIIVDNEDKAKEAISYLKEKKLGRATFLPLNIIKPKAIDNTTYQQLKNQPSFIDIAANLVTYDEIYRNIILNQLGNVIVVDNIKAANQLAKIINYRYKIVTLDGELLHVGGSITGGRLKKEGTLLNEQYLLKEEQRLLFDCEEELNHLQAKLNDLNLDLEKDIAKQTKLNEEYLSLEQIIIHKNKLLTEYNCKKEELKLKLKGMTNTLNQDLDQEEKDILKDYYQIINQRDKLVHEIELLTNKNQKQRVKIDNLEETLKADLNTLKIKEQTLKNLEIRVNRLDVKLDNLLNHLNEEYKLTFEKAKQSYFLTIKEKEAKAKVNQLKSSINELGIVNLGSIEQYEQLNSRYLFLTNQKNDLLKAEDTLLNIIKEMDLIMIKLFSKTFKEVNEQFKLIFKQLFKGGKAELKLTEPDSILTTGIDIIALPPGKKIDHLSLLSGGEKSLTALALLFAILKVRPVPFCLLDEVEAALDEINILEFVNFISNFKKQTQFIVITHQKKTMEYVDVLYGITMMESGVSKIVSVKLEEVNS